MRIVHERAAMAVAQTTTILRAVLSGPGPAGQTGRRRSGRRHRGPETAWLRRCARLLGERSVALAEANRLDMAAAPGYGLTDAASRPPAPDPPADRRDGQGPGRSGRPARADRRDHFQSPIRPNGLEVQKVRVPLGVIFFIYESRPNVTADAAALCVKAGNAVILRGGKEAAHSNAAIAEILAEAAADAGLPADAVQLVATTDREAVGHLLRMPEYINLAIPRGGESLIRRVSEEARMPVIKHFAGNCHVYLDQSADPDMAERIVVNAKCQRMGVCNAAESLVVHADVGRDAAAAGRQGAARARHRNPRRRAHAASCCPQAKPATEEDYRAEYLGPIISVQGGRFAGRGDRAHQPLRLAAHRGDRHPRPRRGPAVRRPRSTARR